MNHKTMRRWFDKPFGSELRAELLTIAPTIFVGVILLSFATMGLNGITQVAKPKPPLKPVSAEYADKHMPKGWWMDPKIIAEGKQIYEGEVNPDINCFSCHGKDGAPTTRGARDLRAVRVNRMSDSYWFWRISEGVPDTPMQPWKALLTEEDIWKVMAYEHQFSHSGKVEEHDHPEIERRVAGEGASSS